MQTEAIISSEHPLLVGPLIWLANLLSVLGQLALSFRSTALEAFITFLQLSTKFPLCLRSRWSDLPFRRNRLSMAPSLTLLTLEALSALIFISFQCPRTSCPSAQSATIWSPDPILPRPLPSPRKIAPSSNPFLCFDFWPLTFHYFSTSHKSAQIPLIWTLRHTLNFASPSFFSSLLSFLENWFTYMCYACLFLILKFLCKFCSHNSLKRPWQGSAMTFVCNGLLILPSP